MTVLPFSYIIVLHSYADETNLYVPVNTVDWWIPISQRLCCSLISQTLSNAASEIHVNLTSII